MLLNYDSLLAERFQYLNTLYAFSEDSRKFSKDFDKEFCHLKICSGRFDTIEDEDALPAEIASQISKEIIEIFENGKTETPSDAFVDVSENIISAMKKPFESEDQRSRCFIELLRPVIQISFPPSSMANGPDGYMTVDLANQHEKAVVLLFEGKHQQGYSGDPQCQCILDYSKYCGHMAAIGIDGHYPCLIVSLAGSQVSIRLGIVTKHVLIHSLVDGFFFHGKHQHRITEGAKLISSLHSSLMHIRNYYSSNQNSLVNVICPGLHSIRLNGWVTKITYTELLKQSRDAWVYVCKVLDTESPFYDSDLIVKFTHRYHVESHRLLSNEGLAPTLHDVVFFPSGWKAVVMDRINPVLSFFRLRITEERKQWILQNVERAITILHSSNYVHGDVRLPNILVSNDRVYMIDFDFSGEEGIARYPRNLDMSNFPWVSTESELITKQFDLDAVERLKYRLL